MRIQHNIMAMNAYRNYNTNTKALSANLEKLSSGYKINRAGDDAAGLAISEKMRAQITGLDAAQKNVKDGISFVKTAEGAMQEIQDMLKRMKYLATQSANGTYQDPVDRENLDKEVKSLTAEINRIAQSANFNGIYMLNGSTGTGGDTPEDALTAADITAPTSAAAANFTDGGAGAGATAELDFAGIAFAKSGTVTVSFGGKDYDVAVTKDTDAAAFATAFKAAYDADKLNDAGGTGEISATVNGTKVTFQGATDAGVADNDIKNALNGTTAATFAPKAGTTTQADAPAAAGPTFKGDTAGLAKFGIASVDLNGAQELTAATDVKAEYDGTAGKLTVTIGGQTYEKTFANTGEDAADIKGTTIELTNTADATKKIKVAMDATVANVKIGKDQTTDIDKGAASKIGSFEPAADDDDNGGGNAAGSGKGTFELTLQIGDDANPYNQMTVKIGGMRTDDLMGHAFTTNIDPATGSVTYEIDTAKDVKQKSISQISIAERGDAADAIEVIKNAINYVSSVRGDLGATQNRLDHTLNNLSVMTENIQDAESTIRDTDVAEEMMAYTKNNILVQSAQAMLAQANQVPQGVLQLLG